MSIHLCEDSSLLNNHQNSNLLADEQDTPNKNRPDYKIDIYEAYGYSYTNVYDEIKSSKNISLTLLVNAFYRVTIFSNDAIDKFNLRTVIGFQAAGPSITWLAMNLAFEKMYTFTEIVSMDIP
ncbi:hypothetical protein G6F37_000590 [Rhizopus arrhizus]|nr:hypothetical protein G6F38_000800 [Rhizopus arrhizus]KAG1164121.1 hypothetical protein G6F37_000590 [Rhizopus arrhizus]